MLAFAGSAARANAQANDKLDHALREGKKAGKSQRVILRARPGYEAWARQLLRYQHGKGIEAELPSIGALTAELQGRAKLMSSVSRPCFWGLLGRSSSSFMLAQRSPGGQENRHARTPALKDALARFGPGLQPSVDQHAARHAGHRASRTRAGRHGRGDRLRHSPVGGVPGRIKAFYDFTGGTVKRAQALRRLRSRHSRCRPDRRPRAPRRGVSTASRPACSSSA